jgi:hypothetical protein
MVRTGQPRPTVRRAVVCGPCWAAHGGSPGASEIGPAPSTTAPSCDPIDQAHWLRALRRQEWVQEIRVDGRRGLLAVARTVALWADWDTLESRPTWEKLAERTGLHERSVARWLQELRVRGWLAHLERGSTPATRPMALAHLDGNRAALYGLRIPLTPEEALARAGQELVGSLETSLRAAAGGSQPSTRQTTNLAPEQVAASVVGDKSVSLPRSFQALKEELVGGSTRARQPVDNMGRIPPDQEEHSKTALRAGSEEPKQLDFSILVPVTEFEMLVAADLLRQHLPVFSRCSRKLVRRICRPYWRAGWCNRDITHAMDHRPSVFSQPSGVLLSPEYVASPRQFIRSRLRAWLTADGTVLTGYWSSRVTHADAARAARQRVADRHGRAGVRMLRAGEQVLTADRIAEHGRHARLPVPAPAHLRTGLDRARKDRLRAELVARARSEIARLADQASDAGAHATGTAESAAPASEGAMPGALPAEGAQDTSRSAYERALAKARAEGRAAAPRGGRRRRGWSR